MIPTSQTKPMNPLGPIRKPFQGDPLFPFAIVHKDRKSPQMELPDHLHDRYELVYVYGGQGTFFIDNAFYDMRPGDLFLIPGNTIHRALPDPVNPVLSSAVFFAASLAQTASLAADDDGYSALLNFEMARKRKLHRIELPAEMRQAVEDAIERMEEEMRRRLR